MNKNTEHDKRSTVIALDAMGGDYAPREIVMGAVAVAGPDLRITLTGRTAEIERYLAEAPADVRDYINIVEAPDVIGFDEEPAKAVRNKDNSSLVAACREVAEGRADGMVSAGSTGAIMAAALIKLRRIKGLKRPGLCAILPTPGRPTIFIDVGANSAVRPIHLLEFAIMGGMFAEQVLDLKNPSVGLLSIGEESVKGDEVVLEAHRLLANTPGLNFYGNVEGGDIVGKVVDVVVTDGFTGNVSLKLMESTAALIVDEIRQVAASSLTAKLGGLLLRSKLREFKKSIDTEEFGGAYLLGVRGLVVICHGNSSRKAIASALKYAGRAARQELITKLERRIAEIE
ncbi:MAG: phosphate acyltransferase PlsX [Thermoleophilia bacterium]